MQKIRWRYRSHAREITRNACAAAISSIRNISDRCAIGVAEYLKMCSNTARTDSESRIFARNRLRLIRGDFARRMPCIVKHRERAMTARVFLRTLSAPTLWMKSDAELELQEIVDGLRVVLAARGF